MTEEVAPKPVRVAAIGIFVLAALHLDVLWTLLSPDGRSSIDNVVYQSVPGSSSAAIDSARTSVLVAMTVSASVLALLLVWLAVKTRGGRHWARVAVTVVVALELLARVHTQLQPGDQPYLAGQLLTLADLLVRVGVLALLWAPEDSRRYFRAHSRAPVHPDAAAGGSPT